MKVVMVVYVTGQINLHCVFVYWSSFFYCPPTAAACVSTVPCKVWLKCAFLSCSMYKKHNTGNLWKVLNTSLNTLSFIAGWICTAWRGWRRCSTTKWRRRILISLESVVFKTVVAVKSLEWIRTLSIIIMCTANFHP